MMAMLTTTARLLRNTPESIATPSWVKACGEWWRTPQLEITICDPKCSKFLFRELEHEIYGKSLAVMRHGLVERSRGHTTEFVQVEIEHNLLPA